MKKFLSSLVLAASLVAGPALAADAPVDVSQVPKGFSAKDVGKSYSIATVVKVDGIAWFDRMREGAKQFGADTGHDTWMVGPSQADAAAQVQLVENLIAQGVDAICVVPFSVEALEPVLKKARDRGIVVIAHEASNITNADFVLEAFDNLAYGAKLMEVLGTYMKGEGKYVTTVGSLTSKSQNEWIDGAIAYQKAHFPKMEQATGRLETYDDANTDYNKLKEVLTTYPDIKGILGGPMPTSAGAGRLISERGLKDKLFFAGTGLVSVAGEYLSKGDIQYIQFWDPAVAAYAMNIVAVMALDGKADQIKAGLNLGLPGYTSLTAPVAGKDKLLYGAGWVGVTKDNMEDYNF
ncbi:autoinducer 2 ABC transporter substrate-binding protein [Rhodospirillum rubrum]|uniref:Periplasmic binding protein/LacI transcriptional regulator n=1 Tax=Rhodospirillum rubrum (strain ATCC 11170 / ATH 1.1.1 / DSM 467 / LMG 4362 / NCIMB 8255 / S1) TaxID=269796 RepID=Q2RRZ3_RHORT|nr:autoinducer 2 ABC transporter substrate-binding protein [Rhodospirillum rubrum]ABC23102.1 Periplasmic binding protein/LacI transcriptional regulator [Rhodospirillum rubrum ATCC 11170]AEO48831.1 periplasmic binding protein/LacI transcriptional regulator [Rhodospirillum rubrum F11]MBK5954765.1 autoinducer 2 ABC transporter substrate-binding protein [Rhodospirillum rubrum]QXG79086.1 autoinducer 2 ABC transporter substrate-binding protein [Rhodospirillum rubrum]HAP98510.1 autoinducer 2 ABC tran